MTEILRNRCALFERNRSAIAGKFLFEKAAMCIAAGLIFTGANKEADLARLKECRSILNRHTVFFSEYRETVKSALISEMALSDDAEQYIEDVKAVYTKLHKGHFRDNSYMVLAAMLICELDRQNDAERIVEKHNEIMKQMEKQHPILTDSEDISYVILLAMSDRPIDQILSDMNECLDYLKNTCKVKVSSDSVQRLSEILSLTDGDIREKCDKTVKLYDTLQSNKAATEDGYVFSSLGMLTGVKREPEIIVSEILEAYEYLKDCKGFDDKSNGKKQRLTVAVLLFADSCGSDITMINNALINNALSVIKAQQTATMITVISNLLSAVLSVVADKNSTETNSTDTDENKEQTMDSYKGQD